MNQWYYLLGILALVASLVTAFWKWYYGQKLITREEAFRLIDEKSFPKKNGELMEKELVNVNEKIDEVLDSQKNVEQNLIKIEKIISNEMHGIKIEFAKLITEHNAFKHLHKIK